MTNSIKITLLLAVSSILFFNSCKKKGCTDSASYAYDADAKTDDGSCKFYYGGKDYGQLDVGSEVDLNNEFDIYFDGVYIGRSLYYFPTGLSCGNAQVVGKVLLSGSHVVKAVGNGGTVVKQSTVILTAQSCKVVLIENLQLVSSGGSAGYNCSGGTCYSVADGATYATYGACQTSCGGGSSAGYNCVSGTCQYVSSNADYATSASCESNCGGGSAGNLTFWVNQDLGCGTINVAIASYGSGAISFYYSGEPGCGSSGCANFNGLSYGAYYYTVTSDNGCTWSGNVTVDTDCQTVQLTL